jgi:DNA (cytosine-5)-methyltransferase 1
MIVDLFAGGAAGWDWAARSLGLDDLIGIELDASACALRAATGLRTIRADVATFPLDHLPPVIGVMAGPPCQSFSRAGKRKGLLDPRGRLVYEPLRWAKALRPEWMACEQVKEVLPIWRQMRDELAVLGYSAWCGVLDAASYGTPQHRLRAILIASRVVQVQPPAPTHGRAGDGGLWGAGVEPLVTMAEALGWAPGEIETNNCNGGDPDQRYRRPVDRPAPTVTSRGDLWRLRTPGRSYDGPPRIADPTTEPAPTVALGHNASSWCWERPSTTVVGRNGPKVVSPYGGGRSVSQSQRDSIPVELWELGVLQHFPADHPWHAAGTKEAQARCIGNAIPIGLARAVLGAVVGAEAKEVAA